MRVNRLHEWHFNTSEAMKIQRRLAAEVSRKGRVIAPKLIAGVDISVRKGQEMASGAVVVLNYPELKVVETRVARGRLNFPYIPGFLSFRELPLILAACEQLIVTPDLIIVDGQGIAHPRRFGLASHLGLFLDTPTIGCAKSRLCRDYKEPGIEPGSHAEITDKGETVGAALRTKLWVKPVYISIGHKIDLQDAIHWVLECCRGYRLPEATRLAHQAAGENAERQKEMMASAAS